MKVLEAFPYKINFGRVTSPSSIKGFFHSSDPSSRRHCTGNCDVSLFTFLFYFHMSTSGPIGKLRGEICIKDGGNYVILIMYRVYFCS